MTARAPGRTRRAALGVALLTLSACATPSSPGRMTLDRQSDGSSAHLRRLDHAVRVGQVIGGTGTVFIGLSQVSNEALRAAAEASLRNQGYLADDPTRAGLRLDLALVDLDHPAVALDPALLVVPIDLSVTARIRYTLTAKAGGPPLFDEVVATTGTASAQDAASPAGRVRRANEKAVRLNFAEFLHRLDQQLK